MPKYSQRERERIAHGLEAWGGVLAAIWPRALALPHRAGDSSDAHPDPAWAMAALGELLTKDPLETQSRSGGHALRLNQLAIAELGTEERILVCRLVAWLRSLAGRREYARELGIQLDPSWPNQEWTPSNERRPRSRACSIPPWIQALPALSDVARHAGRMLFLDGVLSHCTDPAIEAALAELNRNEEDARNLAEARMAHELLARAWPPGAWTLLGLVRSHVADACAARQRAGHLSDSALQELRDALATLGFPPVSGLRPLVEDAWRVGQGLRTAERTARWVLAGPTFGSADRVVRFPHVVVDALGQELKHVQRDRLGVDYIAALIAASAVDECWRLQTGTHEVFRTSSVMRHNISQVRRLSERIAKQEAEWLTQASQPGPVQTIEMIRRESSGDAQRTLEALLRKQELDLLTRIPPTFRKNLSFIVPANLHEMVSRVAHRLPPTIGPHQVPDVPSLEPWIQD